MIRSTVNLITYSLVPTGTVYDVTSVHSWQFVASRKPVLSVLNILWTAKAAFCISIQLLHLTKLSCVGFC